MLSDVQSLKTHVSYTLSHFLVVSGRRVNTMHMTLSFPEAIGFVFIWLARKFIFKMFSVKMLLL